MDKQLNTEPVHVRVPRDMKCLLEQEANDRAVSISTVVRWAISEYFKRLLEHSSYWIGPEDIRD